ncbi:hypothetical protein [Kitasatospora sp. DSM 101779]|uniref:hypothetical protein n=1 Tax=Kitasatospora sp. DSM 101779 TaxID=2853165 RepID=UPI0021D7F07B|nr:hypothetical protein [Kitasatospora sp. DSM 101779]MCU7827327.1 hypothetical protein [Kitasatospora sp. DSM 101779]MCU7827410.1 hypothetical protein [Kitasatospora sp. DSM 101779]
MSQTTPAAPPQGSHHYILTLQKPMGGGFMISSSSGTCSPAGMSRYDVYTRLVADMVRQDPQLAGASVLHFDLQPNQL